MTRQDYVLIASAFKDELETIKAWGAVEQHVELQRETLRHLAVKLAAKLAQENERFNRELFLRACGFVDDARMQERIREAALDHSDDFTRLNKGEHHD